MGEVTNADSHRMQVFNILLRKCLACLNLQLVGRNYFDAAAKVRNTIYKCLERKIAIMFFYRLQYHNINWNYGQVI